MSAIISTGQLYQRNGAWLLRGESKPVSLDDTDTAVSNVHIATVGEWLGHEKGPIEFTAEVFDQFIANWRAQKTPMQFDYEHRSLHPTHPDSTASGWVSKLFRKGEGDTAELWACVEWVPEAAEKIRAKELRFCSPAFHLEDADRKSGKPIGARLINVALTNIPFLDGQTPITCTQRLFTAAEKIMTPEEQAKADEEAAKGEPKKAAEGADEGAAALTAFVESVASAAGVDVAAAVAALSDLSEQIGDLVRTKLDKDGMPSEAAVQTSEPASAADPKLAAIKIEALTEQVKALRDATTVLMSEHAASKAKAKAEQEAEAVRLASERKTEIEKAADKLINEGYARDGQRDSVIYLLTNKPEMVPTVFGEKLVPIGETQAGNEAKPETSDAEAEAALAGLSDRQRASYLRLCSQRGFSKAKALSLAMTIESRSQDQSRATARTSSVTH